MFWKPVISVLYSAVWAWANAVKLLVYAMYTLYTVVLYMQIYYCETQTSLQTRRAYTEVLRGPTICKSAERKLANRKWVHIYGGSVLFFLPYMSSLRDNESRGERPLNKTVTDVVCLFIMMMINDNLSLRRMKIMSQ